MAFFGGSNEDEGQIKALWRVFIASKYVTLVTVSLSICGSLYVNASSELVSMIQNNGSSLLNTLLKEVKNALSIHS